MKKTSDCNILFIIHDFSFSMIFIYYLGMIKKGKTRIKMAKISSKKEFSIKSYEYFKFSIIF